MRRRRRRPAKPASDIRLERLHPTTDVRVALVDEDGTELAALDLEHADARAMYRALGTALRVRP